MQTNYSALGFAVVLVLGALAVWFIFGERFLPAANSDRSAQEVPLGTTPRQP